MTYSYLLRSTPPRKIAHYTFLEGTFLNFLVSKPQLREMVENHMEVQKEKARMITMQVCRLWKSLTCEHQIVEVAGLGREVAEVNVADMLRKAWVRFDEARS